MNKFRDCLLITVVLFTISKESVAQVVISIPDSIVSDEVSTIYIPIYLQKVSPDSISGFTFNIEYSSDIIQVDGYSKTEMTTNFFIQDNNETPGIYRITGASSSLIYSEGALIDLVISIKSLGNSKLNFTTASANEGNPEVEAINGHLSVLSYDSVPIPISPLNEQVRVSINPTLTWSANRLYDSSELQYSENDQFNPAVSFTNLADTVVQLSNLEFETEYYWRVRSVSQNRISGWSATQSFTVRSKENKSPIVISKLRSIELDEDFGELKIATLDTVFYDEETTRLDFELLNTDTISTARIEERGLILTSKQDVNGHTEFVVKASDEEGVIVYDTLSVFIIPVNDSPIASFELTIDTPNISLTNNSTDIDGDELLFYWDFGDGKTSTEKEPQHTYTLSGIYSVKLTVSDGFEEDSLKLNMIEIIITGNEDVANQPKTFKLHQNYPNPFNPSTNIEFSLPQTSNVELRVFDLTGREVVSLVSGVKTAGNHTVSFDASQLSSGVYIYRLKAGEFVQTRKMLLIK